MSEWQPIETCPREPFVRILGCGYYRRANRGDPMWVDIILWGYSSATREVSVGDNLYKKEAYRKDEGWRRIGDHGERGIDFEPEYWMPLPEPPK